MKKREAPEDERKGWQEEISDLLRGLSGAFIFGAPLLYTMEVWYKGDFTSPPRMAAALAVIFGSLLVLLRAAGFRAGSPGPPARVLADAVKGTVIALLGAALSLWMIGMLKLEHGLQPALGRIVVEGIPFAIGLGISGLLLNPRKEAEEGRVEDRKEGSRDNPSPQSATLADAGATILGAVLISSSIAPTEEIPLIAAGLSPRALVLLVLGSLAISYIIVFEAAFVSQEVRMKQEGIFQSPVSETVFSYLISLLVSAFMLWLFQTVTISDPPGVWLSYAVVLGFPAAVGGAAGRLAV